MDNRVKLARITTSIGLIMVIISIAWLVGQVLYLQAESDLIAKLAGDLRLVAGRGAAYFYLIALVMNCFGLAIFGYGLGWLTMLKKHEADGEEEPAGVEEAEA